MWSLQRTLIYPLKQEPLQRKSKDLTKGLTNAVSQTILFPFCAPGQFSVPVWNDNCEEAIKERRKALQSSWDIKRQSPVLRHKGFRVAVLRLVVSVGESSSWNVVCRTDPSTPVVVMGYSKLDQLPDV